MYKPTVCNTALCQEKDKEQEIKHRLHPYNACLRAKDLDLPAGCPREELDKSRLLQACMVSMFFHHPCTTISKFCVRQSCTNIQIMKRRGIRAVSRCVATISWLKVPGPD